MNVLRPYQSRVVEFLQSRRRGFAVAPAGSGKTIMAASAAALKAQPFDRIVWLANTREQCDQARAACASAVWPHPVTIDVHCVAAQPDVSDADIVIVDECHHLPARTWWTRIIEAEGIVWGFSATPWCGDADRDEGIQVFFGADNFITIPRSEVIDGGNITKGMVVVHDLDSEGEFNAEIAARTEVETSRRAKVYPHIPWDEHERRARWQFTSEIVRTNPARNARILSIANEEERSVLILVGAIEHGEALKNAIDGAQLVYSKLGKKKRAAAIAAFRSGALRVMIATSLADEGLDVPRASVLILAAGGRSAGKLEQRAGRVMRPYEGKEFGIVHDFADRGASVAHNQFKARARTYKQLGYQITTARVDGQQAT